MFVQVIQGKVNDVEVARERLARWRDEVCPHAVGLLGATAGVTDDGSLIQVIRFRSQGEAGANSVRPEQRAWWEEEMGELLEGPVTHHDCTDVVLIGGGGSDEAGFVQVLQIDDPGDEPLPQVARVIEPLLRRHRPDIIGELLARADDGAATEVVYFTSEEEARAHEAEELPEDAAAAFRDLWGGAFARARFLDLRSPVLVTPA